MQYWGITLRALKAFSPPSVLVLQAKLDSRSSAFFQRSSRLDNNLWTSASSSVTSSINSSSTSSARLGIICRSSNSFGSPSSLTAVCRHLCFLFTHSQSLSASHIAQDPSQPRSQGLSSLPPLVVGRKTLIAAAHVPSCDTNFSTGVGSPTIFVDLN